MFGKIVIFVTLLGVGLAELPVSAPYAPSGWKPQGRPFDLPNEYVAPLILSQPGVELEITKERVDFAGQFSGSSAAQVSPNSAYLPPNEVDEPLGVDIIRVQGLPSGPTEQFKVFRSSQLNTREYQPQRQSASIRKPQRFLNIKLPQFSRQILQPVKVPAAQYGAPIAQPANQYGAPIAQPASQYGAPAVQPLGYQDPRLPADGGFRFPDEENEEITDSSVTKGEYFVLTPEKTLQKVSYKTSQSEEEAQNNAFTAELKYRPVDKIDGPLYKYNEKGQLVRIYKK